MRLGGAGGACAAIFPPAGHRRAATMSTAAFHISSLLEKMTSSDKDFRCASQLRPASPPPLKPRAFHPTKGMGPPPDPAVPLILSRVKPRPFAETLPSPSPQHPHGSPGWLLPGLHPCPLHDSNPCFISGHANFNPCLLSPIKAPAPPRCTLPLPLLSSFTPSLPLAPHLMRPQ